MATELQIRVADGKLFLSVAGSTWTEELANNFVVMPTGPRQAMQINSVGEYAADIKALFHEYAAVEVPRKLRAEYDKMLPLTERAEDRCPFPDVELDLFVTGAAVRYFAHRALTGSGRKPPVLDEFWNVVLKLDWPGWATLRASDRDAFVSDLSKRHREIRQLWINGEVLVVRRRYRRTWRKPNL